MTNEISTFHFAEPLWLLALAVPILVWLWLRFSISRAGTGAIERYADAELLPHLVRLHEPSPLERRRRLRLWSLLWVLSIVALAGPRWGFTKVSLFEPSADLLVLMDLSRSMEATDVRPSRIARARQELHDLVALEQRFRLGLVAFASLAYVVAPMTEDRELVSRLIPSLTTQLTELSGSRLGNALDRAERLLLGQKKGSVRAILLITDGDFAEPGLEARVARLADQGVRVHVLGIGTPEGDTVPALDGRVLKSLGEEVVVSRLEEDSLKRLANAGRGVYRRADFRDDDIRDVLAQVLSASAWGDGEEGARRAVIWNERFHWLVAPALLLLIPTLWAGAIRGRRGPTSDGEGR